MLGMEHWMTVIRPPMGCYTHTQTHRNTADCCCCKVSCNNVAYNHQLNNTMSHATIAAYNHQLQTVGCKYLKQNVAIQPSMHNTVTALHATTKLQATKLQATKLHATEILHERTRSFVAAWRAGPRALRSDLPEENIRGRSSIRERKIWKRSSQ